MTTPAAGAGGPTTYTLTEDVTTPHRHDNTLSGLTQRTTGRVMEFLDSRDRLAFACVSKGPAYISERAKLKALCKRLPESFRDLIHLPKANTIKAFHEEIIKALHEKLDNLPKDEIRAICLTLKDRDIPSYLTTVRKLTFFYHGIPYSAKEQGALALELAAKRLFTPALEIAETLPPKSWKSHTLSEVALQLGNAGRFDQAVAVAHSILDKDFKVSTLESLERRRDRQSNFKLTN